MATSISIKGAPDDLVRRLKARAARHHRSLQGEVLAILEEAVREDEVLDPKDVARLVREMGLSTPAESAEWIREDRDRR